MSQRLEGSIARCGDDRGPRAGETRQKGSTKKRALAGARWSDQREQARPFQFLPEPLGLHLAPEEILRVVRGEGRKPGVGTFLLESRQSQGDFFERTRQSVSGGIACVGIRSQRLTEHRGPRTVRDLRRSFAD